MCPIPKVRIPPTVPNKPMNDIQREERDACSLRVYQVLVRRTNPGEIVDSNIPKRKRRAARLAKEFVSAVSINKAAHMIMFTTVCEKILTNCDLEVRKRAYCRETLQLGNVGGGLLQDIRQRGIQNKISNYFFG